ncbi:MAG: 2-oxoglutarate dehydrogenase complex dihydrolipoyllysine-residue succinyltransferase [Gemmatimonadaceae bacterium]|nr:2-oxoglutarate dehydrogenase complex dihydrolipoyllysine-residue succinyltransferase [Gemmatimonadaceae bacterium]
MLSIKVPPLGESIVEATISRWLKREGDRVASGETLVELETDKVTVEVPAQRAGVLTKRYKAEGDVVAVNDVLADLDEAGEVAAAEPVTVAQAARQPAIAATVSAVIAVPPVAPVPPVAQPAADPSPTRAETAQHSGADVKSSPAARRLAAEENVDLREVEGTGRGGVVSKPDVIESLASAATKTPPSPTRDPVTNTQLASAPVETAAAASSPSASAPVVSSPVSAAAPAVVPAPSPTPLAGTRETREKMTTRRRRIAEHLLQSQHATAHLTTFNEIDMTAVEALRARIKERVEKEHGVKLSMMPFFVKAACMALKHFPVVNAKVDGDHIEYHHYVNMGIAVAAEAGLVVPNLKDADSLGLLDIARAIITVAKKARDGKLTMDDLTGGTFTLTNGGVFGSLVSTPIINYPQVGILGLHKVQERAMVVNGAIVARPMMYVALSYDHRIIDGQQAVLFLVRVKELMEDPALMVVD